MSPLLPLAFVAIVVPPFARAVRFQRYPINTALNLECWNSGGRLYRQFGIPVNDEGNVPVDAFCSTILVYNMSAINIFEMQAVFDVTPT